MIIVDDTTGVPILNSYTDGIMGAILGDRGAEKVIRISAYIDDVLSLVKGTEELADCVRRSNRKINEREKEIMRRAKENVGEKRHWF